MRTKKMISKTKKGARCFSFFLSFFLRQRLTLTPRLKCSSTISAYCNLCFQDSSSSPASASRVAEITGMHHHPWQIFVFLVEMGFFHVDQAGLELLIPSDPPALASQSVGITGISHHSCLTSDFLSKLGHLGYCDTVESI